MLCGERLFKVQLYLSSFVGGWKVHRDLAKYFGLMRYLMSHCTMMFEISIMACYEHILVVPVLLKLWNYNCSTSAIFFLIFERKKVLLRDCLENAKAFYRNLTEHTRNTAHNA
jgi:hypothetical protein